MEPGLNFWPVSDPTWRYLTQWPDPVSLIGVGLIISAKSSKLRIAYLRLIYTSIDSRRQKFWHWPVTWPDLTKIDDLWPGDQFRFCDSIPPVRVFISLCRLESYLRLKSGFYYPSSRPEFTGDRFPLPVDTGRVNGRAKPVTRQLLGPSTRVVETGLYRLANIAETFVPCIVVLDLLTYCRAHKLISKQQHGFICKRSTVTNILSCLNDWACALTNRQTIHCWSIYRFPKGHRFG